MYEAGWQMVLEIRKKKVCLESLGFTFILNSKMWPPSKMWSYIITVFSFILVWILLTDLNIRSSLILYIFNTLKCAYIFSSLREKGVLMGIVRICSILQDYVLSICSHIGDINGYASFPFYISLPLKGILSYYFWESFDILPCFDSFISGV